MSTDLENIILRKLDSLEGKLDSMMRDGCSKADSHKTLQEGQREIFQRLNATERSISEGRGRLGIVMLVAGGALSMIFTWIGKRL
jgi:hypothetical protein